MGIYINGVFGPFKKLDFDQQANAPERSIKRVSREDFRAYEPGHENKWGIALVEQVGHDLAEIVIDPIIREMYSAIGTEGHQDRRVVSCYIASFDWIAEMDPRAGAQLKRIKHAA